MVLLVQTSAIGRSVSRRSPLEVLCLEGSRAGSNVLAFEVGSGNQSGRSILPGLGIRGAVIVDIKQEVDIQSLCQATTESSPMPMAAVDGEEQVIRYVNPAFCLLTRKAPAELIGRTFSEIVKSDAECLLLLKRVYRTGVAETYTSLEESIERRLYHCCALWPVLASGRRILGVMFQVTESLQFHQQVSDINQALMVATVRQHALIEEVESTNEQLRLVNEDWKQFAFAASHDLQEPLRMVSVYSQLLIRGYRGELDGQAGACVEFIAGGTSQMRNLLAELLTYAEAATDSGIASEPVDLNGIVEQVKRNGVEAIGESSAVITSAHLPTIQGQPGQFLQIFQNLISNSIKYRSEQPPRIDISVEECDEGWRFAVADNGIGIDPAYHQQVFGVFKRLHDNAVPGTGMGLAICHRLVTRYGGRIWVESQEGQGSLFYFTLPNSGKSQ